MAGKLGIMELRTKRNLSWRDRMNQEDNTCIFLRHLICNLIGFVQESSFGYMAQSRKAPAVWKQQ